jgi:hypothetical protein
MWGSWSLRCGAGQQGPVNDADGANGADGPTCTFDPPSKSAMKVFAPELSALMTIFRSVGPVISTLHEVYQRGSSTGRLYAS